MMESDSEDEVKNVRAARKEQLDAKIREAFDLVIGADERFLATREEIFWEKVELVNKRRERQIRKAHAKRILWKLAQCENYVPDSVADARELQIALQIGRAKTQFRKMFRSMISNWKKKRAREIRVVLLTSMGKNRESLDFSDQGFQKRLFDLEGEVAWEINYLGSSKAYDDIRWLWSDLDKIDITSLRGRTLEDVCFA